MLKFVAMPESILVHLIWLEPEIELARNYRLSRLQLKQIEEIIEEHDNELTSAW
jgi:hypothetical protein